jgi:beta-N-acetylhexosaminidase
VIRSGPRAASILLAAIALSSCRAQQLESVGRGAGAAKQTAAAPDRGISARAAARLAKLDLEARAAQVLLVGVQGSGAPSASTLALLARTPVGGVVLFGFNLPERPAALGGYVGALQDAAAKNGSGLPLIVAIDHEGGSVFRFKGEGITRIPPPSEVGSRGAKLASVLGEAAGAELRALGVNMALAPVVELLTDENKRFLGSRSYGRAASVVDACAGAYIEGLQGQGVAAVAKHFPGNAAEDPHTALPVLRTDRATYERDCAPRFESAIGRGVAGVMLSHVVFEALDPTRPATLSPAVVSTELKGRLGFRGVAITDDLYMKALSAGSSPERSAVAALAAGSDLLMLSAMDGAEKARDAIVRAVRSGELAAGRLDEAALRVIELKIRFGMDEGLDPAARERRLALFAALVEEDGRKVRAAGE